MKPKTRLYRLTNKAKRGLWIFAVDEQDAINQAIQFRHVKSAEGVKRIEDQTDSRLESDKREGLTDTQEIIDQGLRGQCARIIPGISGADFIAALKSGTRPRETGKPGWTRYTLS